MAGPERIAHNRSEPGKAPSRSQLRALDLFSGAGGLSCGFEWAGLGEVVGAVEIDEVAAETFAANHPAATVWAQDIRTLAAAEVRDALGPIDLILGGPMCQGVSQRGPRDPQDERNFAFWAFADYIRELRPTYFLMENVPAVASDVHNRQLAIAVFEELESLGYHLSAEVVCAAWLGVPQLRYRLVVLGSLLETPRFPRSVGAAIANDGRQAKYVTVGDAIEDLPAVNAGGGLDVQQMPRAGSSLSDYARQARRGARRLFNHWAANTDQVNLDRIRHVPPGGTGMTFRLRCSRHASARCAPRTIRRRTVAWNGVILPMSLHAYAETSPLAPLRTRHRIERFPSAKQRDSKAFPITFASTDRGAANTGRLGTRFRP